MADPNQMRRAIDTGRTRDKVEAPDPAAAPFGTDDEAAGVPPVEEDLPPDAGRHVVDAGQAASERPADERRFDDARRRGVPWLPVAAGLIAIAVLVVVLV
ncbi:hypothetical protein [Oharaeibacter diazotrophicus]|uniref:Uncharacterized protein n=1 Tax=Oharaeibacter diazotrophicus TaxID=1920512 RepID=A0A4R6RAF6_9HYPH|nr:hypothetical protein [Oharaeibacter diazotrophicus]TDP83091.1 hypothetical protein EDD54_3047 [Oharaeibacter diazotrophicus]BBE71922.1 hypothetical protein OHA_1_01507 [Pleomorphomonas sp. SM30]GLS78685.1 hypothetical protein GCM10007904_40220 [Oharaeibacter diazotrophicus]